VEVVESCDAGMLKGLNAQAEVARAAAVAEGAKSLEAKRKAADDARRVRIEASLEALKVGASSIFS
jgi:hypothetical protein